MIWLSVVAAALLLIVSFVVFYLFAGIAWTIPVSPEHWGQLGDFIGGVTGTLLSFISIVLLVKTIRIQSTQLNDLQDAAQKQGVLANVTKAEEAIDHWLARSLLTRVAHLNTVEFGDIVWGLVGADVTHDKDFERAVLRLLDLTAFYCEATALYRSNVDGYFIFKYHQKKANTLLTFLGQHTSLLGQMGGPTLGNCRHLLSGEVGKS
ncbi:hypothetical protein GCM10027046_32920 [Uliginosibacterium flavum]|uniref:Phage abortive infection protein n=1 Tax=Uliginosibacterium flavum TaxID=1396831 RepID=A0ABV2TS98_9RHOO